MGEKEKAIKIIKILKENGFEARLVGGSVRNKQWNKYHGTDIKIKDYDIVTNAFFKDISRLFDNVTERGEGFLVSIINIDEEEFEVSRYRGEEYSDDSTTRPRNVFPVDTLEEDLKRRDFTINTLTEDEFGNVYDLIGGLSDLQNKLIKCVGSPIERFNEDKLRMLRAFRFMSQLDGNIDYDTGKAIKHCAPLFKDIPHERVKEEMNKLLKGAKAIRTLITMKDLGFGDIQFYNSINKKYVDFYKSIFSLNTIELFRISDHLNGKKDLDITEIYALLYGNINHNIVIEELEEMGLLNQNQIKRVHILIKNQMIIFKQGRSELLSLVKSIDEQQGKDYLLDILKSYHKMYGIELNQLYGIINSTPMFRSELPVNGNDVLEIGIKLGLKPGKWIGDILDEVQCKSIRGKEYNIEDMIKGMVQ